MMNGLVASLLQGALMPRFSLVIPAYNVGSYLGDCLQSLKDQTFSDFEAIIVDDASTDTTNSIAASFAQIGRASCRERV